MFPQQNHMQLKYQLLPDDHKNCQIHLSLFHYHLIVQIFFENIGAVQKSTVRITQWMLLANLPNSFQRYYRAAHPPHYRTVPLFDQWI